MSTLMQVRQVTSCVTRVQEITVPPGNVRHVTPKTIMSVCLDLHANLGPALVFLGSHSAAKSDNSVCSRPTLGAHGG